MIIIWVRTSEGDSPDASGVKIVQDIFAIDFNSYDPTFSAFATISNESVAVWDVNTKRCRAISRQRQNEVFLAKKSETKTAEDEVKKCGKTSSVLAWFHSAIPGSVVISGWIGNGKSLERETFGSNKSALHRKSPHLDLLLKTDAKPRGEAWHVGRESSLGFAFGCTLPRAALRINEIACTGFRVPHSRMTQTTTLSDLFYCTFTALLCKSLIISGAGEGNRTLVSGLGSPHSTIEPHPRLRRRIGLISSPLSLQPARSEQAQAA